jgi:protein involved in polysaccharide export with SLBB domain
LSTIIARAGGLTPFASIKSAEIIRTSVTPDQIQLDKLLSLRGGSVTPEDSTYYSLESALRVQHEIVNVDFERLIVQHDTTNDIILRTEDRIVVPSVNRTIYVFGQVVSPGNVPYISGKNVDFYIQRAGGFTDRARTGDVMIIKRSSRQWLVPKETTIEEGDYVWVPKVIERSFGYYMGIIGQAASVVSVAVTVLLLIRTY